MANNIIKRVWNQNKMVNIEGLSGAAFQAESGGHTFQISGIDDTGATVALSGTVTGVFRRPDNADIALTGSASGGVASVTLTDDCYAVPGRFGLTIFVTSGGQKTAVYAAIGTVASTNGGAVAGDTPQDVVDLINAIEAAVATIPADYTDLMAAIAPTYSPSGLYPVGFYVWHDGDLYRCTFPITTAETWTAGHWTAVALGNDVSDLKNAITLNTNFESYTFIEDKYITTNGSTVNINSLQSANGYRCAVADCVAGDEFTVSGRGSLVAALWTFIDSSGNKLSQSTSTSQETNIKITAPTDSAYLVVNSNRQTVKCWKGEPLVNRVEVLETEQIAVNNYIDEIKVFEQSGNIFSAKSDYLEGAYYYRSGSNLVTGTNTGYNGFIIPVAPNSRYTFVTSNIVLLDAEKKPIQTGGSWDYEGVTSCNSGNAAYFAVTYRLSNVPADGYAISKGGVLDYGAYSFGYYAKAYTTEKATVKRVSGAVASGGSLSVLGKTAVKDGQEVVFKGKFSSFNKITIAFSASGSTNAISVDSTNLIVDNNTNSTITEAHGLSIANDITILLEIKKSEMFVSITSMGVTFKYNCFWNQTGGVPSECVATATGMAFSNAEMSVNYSAAKRTIWYFGDSYAQFDTDTRLPYYMAEYGFDENVLFNAVSGGTSYGANQSFNTLLSYGTPTLAVISTGMNNGSDTDANTPSASWLTAEQAFIETCEMNGIVPILCTIPSVPGISHEGKNAWVRASGKRYIDFAGAVGATPAGEWYTGMLSSDNVHPSTLGGNALFTQLIADLPEVMG